MPMREFKSIQKLLSQVRRAVDGYNMIEDGDKIAVGVSGEGLHRSVMYP